MMSALFLLSYIYILCSHHCCCCVWGAYSSLSDRFTLQNVGWIIWPVQAEALWWCFSSNKYKLVISYLCCSYSNLFWIIFAVCCMFKITEKLQANLSPSASAAGQENVRDAWTTTGGCQHCGGRRPPAADGAGTSAQDWREPEDWLRTGEEVELQLETPHTPAWKMETAVKGECTYMNLQWDQTLGYVVYFFHLMLLKTHTLLSFLFYSNTAVLTVS